MANEEKSTGKKRPAKNESDENSPIAENKKLKVEDKGEGKSLNNRRSDERRRNARFYAVCLTCYKHGISTTGEISDFTFSHMCETLPKTIDEDKKKSIEAFNEEVSSQSSLTSVAKAKATEVESQQSTAPSAPPPPPPPPLSSNK